MKRLLDILISTITLIIFSPVFLIIIIVLKLSGEGEVFYLQKRIGHYNRPFKIWKFATMVKNSPNLLTGDVTLKEDPRVLPVGKLLRITKLNELPQIINVLKGDMSIVGARPIMQPSFDVYSDAAKKIIYNTPPGITGIASLIFRDEESLIENANMDPMEFYRNQIIPYKNELDIWYQQNRSFMIDIKIIFLTAWAILFSSSDLIEKCFKNLPSKTF